MTILRFTESSRTERTTIAMAAVFSALGCGGPNRSHPTTTGINGPDATPPPNGCDLGLCPPDPSRGIQLTLDATIPAGEENRFCKYVLFPDAHEYGRMEHRYTTASHHMVLYPTTLSEGTLEAQTHVTLIPESQVGIAGAFEKALNERLS